MKNKRSYLDIADNYLLLGIALGLSFWVLESFVHVYIFQEGNLVQQLLIPETHETWMRLVTIFFVVAFGALAQSLSLRRRQAEKAIKQTCLELDQIFNTAADGMCLIDKDFKVGSLHPEKIVRHAKKGTLLKWNLGDMEKGDERVLSYKVKSRLTILGSFTLPAAVCKFAVKTKHRVVYSNRLRMST